MSATTTPLTAELFDTFADRYDYLGFGYLAGRSHTLTSTDPEARADPDSVARADAWVIAHANRQGWTEEQLFAWANSRDGRYFADVALGAGVTEGDLERATTSWNLLRTPTGE